MCGIIGTIGKGNVVPSVLAGLKCLEYRGYDSAGIALFGEDRSLKRLRVKGKIQDLEAGLKEQPLAGSVAIGHTRWATHGQPSVENAHPHASHDRIALVHNGIIENHAELRSELEAAGYVFESTTDTEVAAHKIHEVLELGYGLKEAVRFALAKITGTYALGIIARDEPDRILAARRGSPLVIGIGNGENFLASDMTALISRTNKFIILEDGDIADIRFDKIVVYGSGGQEVVRPITRSEIAESVMNKGNHRHYMAKEIFEQPRAIERALEGRIDGDVITDAAFGASAQALFCEARSVAIVACGTSFHAGLIAKHWIEELVGIPVSVEVASEFRYRRCAVPEKCLFVTISQSGETADTLAALQQARTLGYIHTTAICNVQGSSLTRESDSVFMTRAGAEIGVASTKAFTTQLAALFILAILLSRGRRNGQVKEKELVFLLKSVPREIEPALEKSADIRRLAEVIAQKDHALYLGRGTMYPVAMEGALKLKEISYIHAEAYPAGELKHGPLALVDENMPVIAIAPRNGYIQKLRSNLEEVRARGGRLYVLTDSATGINPSPDMEIVRFQPMNDLLTPFVYTVPLQLLAYYAAVLKGADVDQPRNLAKSVTVE